MSDALYRALTVSDTAAGLLQTGSSWHWRSATAPSGTR